MIGESEDFIAPSLMVSAPIVLGVRTVNIISSTLATHRTIDIPTQTKAPIDVKELIVFK